MEIDAAEIQKHLLGFLRMATNAIVLPNVYVDGSWWESDVVRVMPSGRWYEYEIKVSAADFKRDFAKAISRHPKSSKKHELYCDEAQRKLRTVPSKFYFVTPAGLLLLEDVPGHCGLLEYARRPGVGSWGIRVVREAPNLRGVRPLSQKAIFHMGVKASWRISQAGHAGAAFREGVMDLDQDSVPSTVEAAVLEVVRSLSEDDRKFITSGGSQAAIHMTIGKYVRNIWSLWEDSPLKRDAVAKYQIAHADDISGLLLAWVFAKVSEQEFDPVQHCQGYHDHWKKFGVTALEAGNWPPEGEDDKSQQGGET